MLSKTQTSMFLLTMLFVSYVANGRTTPHANGSDTIPTRLIPFAALGYRTLAVDPFREQIAATGGYRWYIEERDGRLVSFYPIGAAIVALPLYAPIYTTLAATGPITSDRLFAAAPAAEKLVASLIAAVSAVLLYLTIRRRTGDEVAGWTALIFGLASSMWATASQALWQHGPAVLSIVAALWLLTWPVRRPWTFAGAGAALALAAITRPTAALFAAAGAGFIVTSDDRWSTRVQRLLVFVGGALPVLAFNAAYNWTFYHSPFGVYGGLIGKLSHTRMATGLSGLLVSPNRGLLVFTPVALLGFLGVVRRLRLWREDRLLACFSVASIAYLAVIGSYPEWSGGWSFGPRYLIDILPTLAVAGADLWPRVRPAGRRIIWAAAVWSFLVQFNGAFAYPASRWDARMSPIGLEHAAWDWSHFSLWEDAVAWWRLGKDAPRF